MSIKLELSRRLFSAYSPLKTNKTLINDYCSITSETIQSNNIRSLFNNVIKSNYMNEAVIKSSFIDSFLKRRSPRSNVFIYELNVGTSRADLCVMNGTSSVFEIKTEFDTYDRLDKQLIDYKDYFDYINVIVPISEKNNILELVDSTVGVIVYYINRLGNITFKTLRESKLNILISPIKQLESLTKAELVSLVGENKLSKFELIDTVLKNNLSVNINKLYKEKIKKRFRTRWTFLYTNIDNIHLLDYQWFYNNNIHHTLIYK